MSGEDCESCYYSRDDGATFPLRCHRHAPKAVNSFRFYYGELLRDIAWSQRTEARVPKPVQDFPEEATEFSTYAGWPEVDADDWCGEWRAKNETPNEKVRRLRK